MPSLRCYLMGQEALLVHCAEALLVRHHAVLGVIVAEPWLVAWARERGVPVVDPGSDLALRLSAEPFDYLFSLGPRERVPETVVGLARMGAVRFHDGPLPRYAGANAPAWALSRSETRHAVCWHALERGGGNGDVLKERAFPLDERETAYSLNAKCYEAAIESFAELADELGTGRIAVRHQLAGAHERVDDHARPESLALLDWARPARELDALVRALDFGTHDNPLAVPKLLLGAEPSTAEVFLVREAQPHPAARGASQPGTLLQAAHSLRVATADGQLEIARLATLAGAEVDIAALVARLDLKQGARLQLPDPRTLARLCALDARLARHEAFWTRRLAELAPIQLPGIEWSADAAEHEGPPRVEQLSLSLPAVPPGGGAAAERVVATLCAFLARLSGQPRFDVGFVDEELTRTVSGAERFFARHTFMRVDVAPEATFASHSGALLAELEAVRAHGTFGLDLAGRRRATQGKDRALSVLIELRGVGPTRLPEGFAHEPAGSLQLGISIAPDGSQLQWSCDARRVAPAALRSLVDRYASFLDAMVTTPDRPLLALSLLSQVEREQVTVDWNDTARPFDHELCIHQAFAPQVARTPDAIALLFEGEELTYRELDERSNRLAQQLHGLGVGPDARVAVALERSLDLVVSILAVHKAGGAYVPLDPAYPAERIAFMIQDARAMLLITRQGLLAQAIEQGAPTLLLDIHREAIERQPASPPASDVRAHHLAYVIYTSGSTGKPKGVMVEHRNVINFFAGMDERIPVQERRVWLAVTSLSFDISVLELLWTLTRGFSVVLHRDRTAEAASAASRQPSPGHRRPLDFSLFYFASDEGEASADKYRLLIEGARFADDHGFVAVWTPERHFHAFGGLFPNPSVLSAALAMITKRVQLRAGSCVLPLHHPIRVVEEWSLVDNLSNGRVGISFAAGWQPNDFVIAPERFADRKQLMLRDIDTVRRLWRGESLRLTSPTGQDVDVRTLPRPIQKELPIWVTAAGTPETFQQAGSIGANLLTHLLGQTFDELAQKCALYRKAWRDAGHPGRGTVTLMLHSFVGEDEDEVRETVRGPMKGYLRSAMSLIKQAAWTFPTFRQRADASGTTPAQLLEGQDLSEEDMQALLDHAFERYFSTSGLFGTPETCAAIVDELRRADVDEVGCLMDFGVPTATVMRHMPLLADVKRLANREAEAPPRPDSAADLSLAAQLARHGVSHLQCTPSMLSMILADPASRAALSGLSCVMVGGEAFPPALAKDLRGVTSAQILNMYGPTETTIWSSTDVVEPHAGAITIGRAIANTQLYVLDHRLEPVPPGVAGELMIGGAGVVRGYLHRPELTAERFIRDPFRSEPGARLYRTGDLARWTGDGRVEFLGRLDQQVKIRGHRVELGEIEAALLEQPGVREAVVVAREDGPADVRLVGYVSPRPGAALAPAELRARLRQRLPEPMVPAQIVELAALPLTPNAKIDRKALPDPGRIGERAEARSRPPASELERIIAQIWTELLHVQAVGRDENFFDLGGHSLLTVQAHRKLRELTGRDIALTDLFRFPTVRSLAEHLEAPDRARGAGQVPDRVAARRRSTVHRRELRQRRRPQGESGQ